MIRFFLLFFAFIFSFRASAALNPDMGSMSDLTDMLALFTSYEASFKQKTYDQNQFEIQSLTGAIRLKKPCYFYWEADEPFAQKLVSDCQKIWHYDLDLEQVVVQEYEKQRENAPVMMLLEDTGKLASEYKMEHQEKKGNKIDFYLRARSDTNVLNYIHLTFINEKISALIFTDSLHQKTEIIFSSVMINLPANEKYFAFSLPENVDVLYE